MSRSSILTCDDLKEVTGYQRAGDVARCLRDQGIHVFEGRYGPWTTIELINQAGGLVAGDGEKSSPAPEDIL